MSRWAVSVQARRGADPARQTGLDLLALSQRQQVFPERTAVLTTWGEQGKADAVSGFPCLPLEHQRSPDQGQHPGALQEMDWASMEYLVVELSRRRRRFRH